MNAATPAAQRGVSFSGFLFIAFILVMVIMVGLKLIPSYMQYGKIKNVFAEISRDPELQKATPREIRESFSKRASIDTIDAIKVEDIDISTDQGRLVLSASYAVKVPLVANISLYLDFNPTSVK